EGEHGFYRAFAGGFDARRLEELLASLGREWELERLTFKPYPCGSIAHPYMDCALRLRELHRLRPDQITDVRCRTAAGPVDRLWEPLAAKQAPRNGYAAKFSLPYLLAVILVKGRAGLAEFEDEAVRDAEVLGVAARVSYELDPTIDYPRQFVGHVRIRLSDGRLLEERQDHPRGGSASAQDARVDAARKEGKVVWSTSLALSSSEKVAKLFEAAYPGISVEVHRTGSQRILQRVMQELQANLKLVDVIHTSDAGHFVLLKEKKLLMKYTPPAVDAFPTGFKDRDGYYYGLRATVNVIAYNTKIIPSAEAPRTWKDLLDPKWKGKLVTAHPGYSGVIATHVLALVHLHGWDYFKQLAQNKPMLVQSAVDPSGVVASGERPVAVNGGDYTFY